MEVTIDEARAGDMVNPVTIPDSVRAAGGGWVKCQNPPNRWSAARSVYVCNGAHKDGRSGWMCTEIRNDERGAK